MTPDEKGGLSRLVTEEILDLKLKKQFADVRLLVIASVALNQFLANVQLPTAVTWTAVSVAVLAPIAKGIVTFFGSSS